MLRHDQSRLRILRRPPAALITLLILALVATLVVATSQAATPASGTINTTGPTLTWQGDATGTGAANGESTCVEGVTCDTYHLTVGGQPADWAGKGVTVKITWTIPANDYDLYIHKGADATGPIVSQSANGAPQTSETAGFDPSKIGTGAYTIHVVYFTTTPGDQYTGTVSVAAKSVVRTGTYIAGDQVFSPGVRLKAPVAARDGEPSSRTDRYGNAYIAGIRGVPAGVDLWNFDLNPNSPTYDPYMRNQIYRGQPDQFSPSQSTQVGADGGGDVDIAVGFDKLAGGSAVTPTTNLAFSSLVAANISTSNSTDRGVTFNKNPAGNGTGGVVADDRQWEEFLGRDSVYLYYRTLDPAVSQIQRSNDGGMTFLPASTAGTIGQAGYIDVHQKTGTVYVSGSTGMVCAGFPSAGLPTGPASTDYTCSQAASDPNGVAHIFFPVKVADDGTPGGTVYVAYSNDHDIFLVHAAGITGAGQTLKWSAPVRVNNGPDTLTSVFPWLETGATPGSVGIAWYGTANATNNDNANWSVFFAQTLNATATTPTFSQVKVSDHFIHASNISEGGLTGTANRNLIDYFQISFDPNGAAMIAYTDDHNDFDGHTYVSHQILGTSINGTQLPLPIEGAKLPPKPTPDPSGAQVTDFRDDVQTGLVGVVPNDSPLDILSIKYSCTTIKNKPAVVATMKVSDLSTTPPGANWRMNFAANTPFTGIDPNNDYSFGASDRADQFYVEASTDPSATSQFTYGTAVRLSSGALSYTETGVADNGAFTNASNTISVAVTLDKLNAVLTAKHKSTLTEGSTLAGLRGETFTAGAGGQNDLTRGGTEYTIGNCGSAANVTPTTTATPTTTGTAATPTTSATGTTATPGTTGTTTTTATAGTTTSGPTATTNPSASATATGGPTQRKVYFPIITRGQ